MIRHPGTDAIHQYLGDELDPRSRARVAAHLADCSACRSKVQGWRAVSREIREGPVPPPAPDLFDRIVARRAAGERVILPLAGSERPRRDRQWISVVAAVVVALVVGSGVFFRAPELTADASELSLFPARPAAGEQIRAEYRASALLSGHDRLVLRARYRTRHDDGITRNGWHTVATELGRGRDGIFRGSFRLPDSVVYAVFAVEDSTAGVVDSNSRSGWELLVRGQDGRPLFEALEQKKHDLAGRNWEEAHATARTAAELYPERAQSWYQLHVFQSALLGETGMDSLRAGHQDRLRRLHGMLAGSRGVSGEEAGGMFFYAWAVGDTVTRDFWRDRLAREHPDHPFTVQNRIVFGLGRMRWTDPARFLAEMERMWEKIGPVHVHQGDLGFGAARDAGDPEAVRRWADRYLHFRPHDVRWVATRLTEIPALRGEGMRRLRAEIQRTAAGRRDDRPLFATAEHQWRQDQLELHSLYGALGKALLASGQTQAGLDTLALAVAGGWDLDLFREAADARLAAGDTSGAVELWARMAVDPGASPALQDSLRSRMGLRAGTEHWRALTAAARGVMRREVLADATTKTVRGTVRLLDGAGKEHSLAELAGGEPTLVIFWSRFCGYALDAVPEIERVAKRLHSRGVRVVTITPEKPSADLRAAIVARGLTLPVYHDTRGDATRAFASSGTPQYFVLDETGRIRFEYSPLAAVERQVAALSAEQVSLRAGVFRDRASSMRKPTPGVLAGRPGRSACRGPDVCAAAGA